MSLKQYQNLIKEVLGDKKNSMGVTFYPQVVATVDNLFLLYSLDLRIVKKALADAIIIMDLDHISLESYEKNDISELPVNPSKTKNDLQNYSYLNEISGRSGLLYAKLYFDKFLNEIDYDFFSVWVKRVVINEILPFYDKVDMSAAWINANGYEIKDGQLVVTN